MTQSKDAGLFVGPELYPIYVVVLRMTLAAVVGSLLVAGVVRMILPGGAASSVASGAINAWNGACRVRRRDPGVHPPAAQSGGAAEARDRRRAVAAAGAGPARARRLVHPLGRDPRASGVPAVVDRGDPAGPVFPGLAGWKPGSTLPRSGRGSTDRFWPFRAPRS